MTGDVEVPAAPTSGHDGHDGTSAQSQPEETNQKREKALETADASTQVPDFSNGKSRAGTGSWSCAIC